LKQPYYAFLFRITHKIPADRLKDGTNFIVVMNEILDAVHHLGLKISTALWRLDLLPTSGKNGKGENQLW